LATTRTFNADSVFLYRGTDYSIYATGHDSTTGRTSEDNPTTIKVGQHLSSYDNKYDIWRSALVFDLGNLPADVYITAIKLKLYGTTDNSETNVNISLVDGSALYTYLSSGDYGTLKDAVVSLGSANTSALSTSAWNDITLNAAGIANIQNQLTNSMVILGLRSSNDVSATAPTQEEFFGFRGYYADHYPQLEITYSTFPNEEYPTTPSFPTAGKAGKGWQQTFQSYIERLTAIMKDLNSDDGNLDMGADQVIMWNGATLIEWDSANSRIVLDDLTVSSVLSLGNDVDISGSLTATAVTANSATVGSYMSVSDSTYSTTLQGNITDNQIGFVGQGDPQPGFGETSIYYYLSSSKKLRGAILEGVTVKVANIT